MPLEQPQLLDSTIYYPYGMMSDADFVAHLFRVALGRWPSEQELDYWLGQMQAGWTREQVNDAIYGTGEHSSFLAGGAPAMASTGGVFITPDYVQRKSGQFYASPAPSATAPTGPVPSAAAQPPGLSTMLAAAGIPVPSAEWKFMGLSMIELVIVGVAVGAVALAVLKKR